MALPFLDLCTRKCLSLLFVPEGRFAFLRQNQRFCLGCCRVEIRVRLDLPTDQDTFARHPNYARLFRVCAVLVFSCDFPWAVAYCFVCKFKYSITPGTCLLFYFTCVCVFSFLSCSSKIPIMCCISPSLSVWQTPSKGNRFPKMSLLRAQRSLLRGFLSPFAIVFPGFITPLLKGLSYCRF